MKKNAHLGIFISLEEQHLLVKYVLQFTEIVKQEARGSLTVIWVSETVN